VVERARTRHDAGVHEHGSNPAALRSAGAIRLRVRAQLRAEWRALLGVALLVALSGAAVLGALAAARRTASAYDRMTAATKAWDVLLNPDDDRSLERLVAAREEVGSLEIVEGWGWVDGVFALPPEPVSSFEEAFEGPGILAADERFLVDVSGLLLLDGRLPDRGAIDEALVTRDIARDFGLSIGDVVRMRLPAGAEVEQLFDEGLHPLDLLADPSFGRPAAVRVVGIGLPFDEIVADEGFGGLGVFVTPAFYRAYGEPSAGFGGMFVRLRPGADATDLRRALGELLPGATIVFQTAASAEAKVDRAVQPFVVSLLVFAGFALFLGLLLAGQAVARWMRAHAGEQASLQSLGMTHVQRLAAAVAVVAVPVAAGTAAAAGLAIAVSGIAPIGPVRDAEPHPGIAVDGVVLAAGGLGLVALLLLAMLPSLWSTTAVTAPAPPRTGARIVRWLTRANAPVPVVLGVRFATGGGRGGSAPAVLVGATTATVLAAAIASFTTSLDHFTRTPALYGADWDVQVMVDAEMGQPAAEQLVEDAIVSYAGTDRASRVHAAEVTVRGRSIPSVAFVPSSTPIEPTLSTGRAPVGAAEIALGAATAAELGVGVGDELTIDRPDGGAQRVAVVGETVLPGIAPYPGSDKTSAGEGALVAPEALGRWAHDYGMQFIAARLRPGESLDALAASLPGEETGIVLQVRPVTRPSDVVSLVQLRRTPAVLLALVVALVAAAVAHGLVLAVRQRRRDLAVLRSFGSTRRQVVAVCLWLATTVALVALAFGLPVGVVVGRTAWHALAGALHVVSRPVVSIAGVALLGAATVALANLVAIAPARRAAGSRPATALRAE
jgi:hypothetical protein